MPRASWSSMACRSSAAVSPSTVIAYPSGGTALERPHEQANHAGGLQQAEQHGEKKLGGSQGPAQNDQYGEQRNSP